MFKVVIPARYQSSRLPGKPLIDLAGLPMVVRVAKQALLSDADEVIVATDHAGIEATCAQHGINCVMTREDWPTGTDRLAEVAEKLSWRNDTVVVNVQGDEPLMEPERINDLAQALLSGDQDIATCGHPIHSWEDFLNPNWVKIVLNTTSEAQYFSRAPIPFPRDLLTDGRPTSTWPNDIAYRHIGMYAYRAGFLKAYPSLAPTAAEKAESLEQLRALGHGFRIKVCIIPEAPDGGVDTPSDVERVRRILSAS